SGAAVVLLLASVATLALTLGGSTATDETVEVPGARVDYIDPAADAGFPVVSPIELVQSEDDAPPGAGTAADDAAHALALAERPDATVQEPAAAAVESDATTSPPAGGATPRA